MAPTRLVEAEELMHRCLRQAALPIVVAVFSFGCGSGSSNSSTTFTEIYTTIIAAKSAGQYPGCTNPTCHFSGAGPAQGALDMSAQATAYKNLVNVPAAGPSCSLTGLKRVVPGNASSSLMYDKVHDASPPCGVQMPYAPDHLAPLTADEQSLIESWINGGAQNN
jgi:hypothetical protein